MTKPQVEEVQTVQDIRRKQMSSQMQIGLAAQQPPAQHDQPGGTYSAVYSNAIGADREAAAVKTAQDAEVVKLVAE